MNIKNTGKILLTILEFLFSIVSSLFFLFEKEINKVKNIHQGRGQMVYIVQTLV